jgi:hypothetical protein
MDQINDLAAQLIAAIQAIPGDAGPTSPYLEMARARVSQMLADLHDHYRVIGRPILAPPIFSTTKSCRAG